VCALLVSLCFAKKKEEEEKEQRFGEQKLSTDGSLLLMTFFSTGIKSIYCDSRNTPKKPATCFL
jgi:hypothetical protein